MEPEITGPTQEVHRELVDAVTSRLSKAGCVAADEEAAELLSAAADRTTLESWLRRREQGEPLAWIIGSIEFCGIDVKIVPGVYVPRLQSEQLARRAADLLPVGGRALDLCTGAGAIAAYLIRKRPTAQVLAVDLDPLAAGCAAANGVHVIVADLDEAIGAGSHFDLVTAVAPYVPTDEIRLLPRDVQRFEPRLALDGGGDGLELVRRICAAASRVLCPGGWLALELGSDQDLAVMKLLEPPSGCFDLVETRHDEDGDLRGLVAQKTAH